MSAAKRPILIGSLTLAFVTAVGCIVFLFAQRTTTTSISDEPGMDATAPADPLPSTRKLDLAPSDASGGSSMESEAQREVEEIYGRDDLYMILFGSDWYESRGYDHADNESYMSYGDEELMALAKSGDPVAEILAISRFRIVPQHRDELEMVHESAVLRGMTASLEHIIGMYGFDQSMHVSGAAEQTDLSEEADNSSLIDRLISPDPSAASMKAAAWALFAQMRGDPSGIRAIERMQGDGELGLSDEQIQTVCGAANQLYKELEAKRLELGYGEFSNDAPRLSYADLGTSSDLCDAWPSHRFECVQNSIQSEGIEVFGYQCSVESESTS